MIWHLGGLCQNSFRQLVLKNWNVVVHILLDFHCWNVTGVFMFLEFSRILLVGIWMFSVKIYWVLLFWHTLNLHRTHVMLPYYKQNMSLFIAVEILFFIFQVISTCFARAIILYTVIMMLPMDVNIKTKYFYWCLNIFLFFKQTWIWWHGRFIYFIQFH
jgi:hypothetical protein